MINIKKIMTLLLALMFAVSVCACGGKDEAIPTTEATIQPTTAAQPNYLVTVVDESGNPISGVLLQMCLDTCVPGKTNENGIAEFLLEEADYKVSLLSMPEGFEYSTDEQEWYFASGETTMTIVLKSVK